MPTSFLDLGVPADLADRLARRGITEPFAIQSATLVDALAGRDLCGRAPTGSGKTLAFGIPLVARVGKARPRRPRGLVLVPTRELAAQVRRELALMSGSNRSVMAVYGGVGFGNQIDALRRGTDIVVACPGRLADLVNRGEIHLGDVDMVVLDEADRMADMGFLPEVRRLLDQVNPDRQTLLFSATLDGDVDVLVRHYPRDPVRHELATPDDAPMSRHVFWRAERTDRVDLATRVVKLQWPALLFCRTKRGADRLAGQLARAGVASAALHGDRSQGQRDRALAAFSAGRVQALVATDIAARGIHVDDVACVVHFDPPADEKDYVHRSGRTGRAGASGTILSLVGGDQAGDTRKLQTRLGLPNGVHDADMAALSDDRHLARLSTTTPASASGGGRRGNGAAQQRRNSRPAPASHTRSPGNWNSKGRGPGRAARSSGRAAAARGGGSHRAG